MRKIFTLLFLLCTSVMALQAQISEDFEAGFAGWTAENIWRHGNSGTNGSGGFPIPAHTNFMACNDDGAGNGFDGSGRLISPAYDLTGLDFPFLRFQAYFPNLDYAGADETAKVFVSDDGGSTWKEILDLTDEETEEWYTAEADLSEYGNQTIQIAFEYNDGNEWNYGFCVDDVEFYQAPPNDIRLTQFHISRFLPAGDMPVTISVKNQGYETVTSMDFTWSDGTDTYTETVSGLNIEPLKIAQVVHPTTFAGGTEAKQYELSASIAMPNAAVDANMMDNDAMGVSSFVVDVPTKVVVGEEKTGTWCTWCPRGAVFLDQMVDNYPDNFIGIAVHNDDPMEDVEYDADLGSAFAGGYPNVVMSRDRIIDPSSMPGQIGDLLGRTAPVSTTGTTLYNGDDNELIVSMNVAIHTEINGVDFNVSAVLVEDGMSGTSSDWAQVNAYSGGNFGPMGGYEALPNPVPASQMVYDHVGRKLFVGFVGDATVIPSGLVDGQAFSTTLKTTVPAGADLEKSHVVLLITDRATGEIYNAAKSNIKGLYPKIASTDTKGCGPFEVEFTDQSDSTASYAWTFEGGTPATSTEKNPTVVFEGPGTHDVKLVAISNTGNTYTTNLEEFIFLDKEPIAGFDYEEVNDEIEFENTSVDGFTYKWNFGDGVNSTKRHPSHAYAAPGTYDVTLEATTPEGYCTNEITQAVNYKVTSVKDVIEASWSLAATPNPFNEEVVINYDLNTDGGQSQLVVYNYMGQELFTKDLNNQSGTIKLGAELSQGIFFVQVRKDQQVSQILKVTKLK